MIYPSVKTTTPNANHPGSFKEAKEKVAQNPQIHHCNASSTFHLNGFSHNCESVADNRGFSVKIWEIWEELIKIWEEIWEIWKIWEIWEIWEIYGKWEPWPREQ